MKNTIISSSLMFMLIVGIYTGWMAHKNIYSPSVTTQSDTVYVYDTIIHTIPRVEYRYKYLTVPDIVKDTVILRDTVAVDTAVILKDYFAKVEFLRTFEDSNLKLTLTDTVTQNKIVGGAVKYQLLKPVIVQPIKPDKGHLFLTHSVDIPTTKLPNYWSNYAGTVSLLYNIDKAVFGAGYTPVAFEREDGSKVATFRVQFGIKIF